MKSQRTRKQQVSDALWEAISPLLPPEPPKPKGGRPRVEDRKALGGILLVLRSGMGWQELTTEMGFGSGSTCWRRVADWQGAGVWERLHRALLDRLGDADAIDWSRVSVDGSSVAAKSNGLDCQGVIAYLGSSQRVRWRRSAFRMVRSLCIHAVSATFLALPAASNRA